MKVVSDQLGHSSLGITADTYTSVLPAVATAAAEAVAGIVPRREPEDSQRTAPGTASREEEAVPFTDCSHSTEEEPQEMPKRPREEPKPQVKEGGPRGARTHNQRIKSPLLCRLS